MPPFFLKPSSFYHPYRIYNLFKQFVFFFWILGMAFGMMEASSGIAYAKEAKYEAVKKRDPFVPLVTLTSRESTGLLDVESIDEIVVEGVAYDPKRGSIVIANGVILKQGQEAGNVKVTKITSEGAYFLINGEEDFKATFQKETEEEGWDV